MAVGAARVGRDITVDERKTAVLRAALACIATTGYDNVRLRDVATQAGVSIGLLQHYFDTRDELVAQAFRLASEDVLRRWEEVLAEAVSPWDRIVALVEQLTERDNLRQRCLVWVDFATAAARHDETRAAFRSIYDQWDAVVTATVRDGRDAGVFHPIVPDQDLVEILLDQIDGSMMSIASGMERLTGQRMREVTLSMASALLGRPTE